MNRSLLTAVATGLCCLAFLGCQSPQYGEAEKIFDELMPLYNEIADAMESVRDLPSAGKAAVKIEQICDRMEPLSRKLAHIKLREAEWKKLKEKPEVERVKERLFKAVIGAGQFADQEPSLMKAFERFAALDQGGGAGE